MLSLLQYLPHWEPTALRAYQTPRWGSSTIKDNGKLDVQKQELAMTLVTPQIATLDGDLPQR